MGRWRWAGGDGESVVSVQSVDMGSGGGMARRDTWEVATETEV